MLQRGKNCKTNYCSVTKSCLTLYNPMDYSTPGFTVPYHLLEFAQVNVHWIMMPSNCLSFCCPLLLLPSIFPSMSVFSSEVALHIRWPKYWSFSFNTSHFNEYSGLISLWVDWFDLLAIQGTRVFSNTTAQKHQFFALSFLYSPTLTSVHDYWKSHSFD